MSETEISTPSIKSSNQLAKESGSITTGQSLKRRVAESYVDLGPFRAVGQISREFLQLWHAACVCHPTHTRDVRYIRARLEDLVGCHLNSVHFSADPNLQHGNQPCVVKNARRQHRRGVISSLCRMLRIWSEIPGISTESALVFSR